MSEMHSKCFYSRILTIVVFGILFVGIILIYVSINNPNIYNNWILSIGIILLMMMISHLIVHPVLYFLKLLFNLKSEKEFKPANRWPPVLVGFCESVMYPIAFLIGRYEFIGVWLAVKVAGGWDSWRTGNEGRNRFQMFLIGNALSISLGFLTFVLISVFALGKTNFDFLVFNV